MKLLQLYYTSCQRGLGQGSGFQVYSMSEGITPEEVRELTQICLYIPPNHLPSQPTSEEIESQFPVSFSSFRLQSGRVGVSQSVYVGKDYTGRYGNYFSHVFLLEEGEWPFAPILLYDSPLFRRHLTKVEENISSKPDPLPPLYLQEPNGSITPFLVDQFLKEPGRYEYLQQLLNSLIDQKGELAALILTDELENIPYWLAALQLSFPLQLGNNISFSTYVYEPYRTNFSISATMKEGVNFSFNRMNQQQNLFIFDLLDGQVQATAKKFRYTDRVIEGQLDIKSIEQFFHGFTLERPSDELDSFLDAKSLANGHLPEGSDRLKNAINFVNHYATLEKKQLFIQSLPLERLIDLCQDLETTKMISHFLIDMSDETGDLEVIQQTSQFLFEKTNDFVTDDYPLDDIEQFLDQQLGRMNNRESVENLFLQDEQLQRLHSHLIEMNDGRKSYFYLKLILQFIYRGNKTWADLTQKQKQFLSFLSLQSLLQVSDQSGDFSLLASSPDIFAQLILSMAREYPEILSKGQLQFLVESNRRKEAWLETFVQTLQGEQIGKQYVMDLFTNWLHMDQTSDQRAETLLQAALCQVEDLAPLVSQYTKHLLKSDENLLTGLAQVMDKEELFNLLHDEEALIKMLDHGQKYILFTDEAIANNLPSYQRFVDYIHKYYQKGSLYELTIITYELKQARRKKYASLERSLLNYLLNDFNKTEEDAFQTYIVWSLPELIDCMYDKRRQRSPLLEPLVSNQREMMLKALVNRRQPLKTKHAQQFLTDLLIAFYSTKMDQDSYETFVEYFSDHYQICKKVDALLKKQSNWKKSWQKMHEDVQKYRGGLFKRTIKTIFRSKD